MNGRPVSNNDLKAERLAFDDARKRVQRGILIAGLLEVRGLVPSGSEAMGVIDETLGKVGVEPWRCV
tara:strand:- start:366 stop:566 length:201 start_codon:yes stop_codon:yes gene_type:complete